MTCAADIGATARVQQFCQTWRDRFRLVLAHVSGIRKGENDESACFDYGIADDVRECLCRFLQS
jgi:hypothetical protein